MNINLLAEGLDGSLAEIVAKLQSLIDSFWIYIVIALAAVVVVWGAYIGIKIAIAHRNEEKINARDMIICVKEINGKKFKLILDSFHLSCDY